MSEALSSREPVPLLQARVRKLNGTRPQSTNTGNAGCLLANTWVKTKVKADMVTRGFSRDQKIPKDMLR